MMPAGMFMDHGAGLMEDGAESDGLEGDSPKSSVAGDVGGLSPASSGEWSPEHGTQRNVPKSRSMLHVSPLWKGPPVQIWPY